MLFLQIKGLLNHETLLSTHSLTQKILAGNKTHLYKALPLLKETKIKLQKLLLTYTTKYRPTYSCLGKNLSKPHPDLRHIFLSTLKEKDLDLTRIFWTTAALLSLKCCWNSPHLYLQINDLELNKNKTYKKHRKLKLTTPKAKIKKLFYRFDSLLWISLLYHLKKAKICLAYFKLKIIS